MANHSECRTSLRCYCDTQHRTELHSDHWIHDSARVYLNVSKKYGCSLVWAESSRKYTAYSAYLSRYRRNSVNINVCKICYTPKHPQACTSHSWYNRCTIQYKCNTIASSVLVYMNTACNCNITYKTTLIIYMKTGAKYVNQVYVSIAFFADFAGNWNRDLLNYLYHLCCVCIVSINCTNVDRYFKSNRIFRHGANINAIARRFLYAILQRNSLLQRLQSKTISI